MFTFPYDLGAWENIKDVVNCSCRPIGDGINYRVTEGCDQYTLTVIFAVFILIYITYFMSSSLFSLNK